MLDLMRNCLEKETIAINTMTTPFSIFHIPHSSTVIPAHVRGSLSLSDEDLAHELLLMTDHYTDELFDYNSEPVCRAVFPVSRLVLDPERLTDDPLEPMAEKGMGVVYVKTSGGRPLRHLDFRPTKTELIDEFYVPHHRELDRMIAESLRDHGSCLILDCHSFPLKPWPFESGRERPRPEICLGTDPFHTPEWLAAEGERLFEMEGFRVERNHPFSGALVPGRFYWKQPRVIALMIEVNRSLYMDEITGKRLPEFLGFKSILLGVLRDLMSNLGEQIRSL